MLPSTRFNSPVLMAIHLLDESVTIQLSSCNHEAQQLGIGESLKLVEGNEFILSLWACEHSCSKEKVAGR